MKVFYVFALIALTLGCWLTARLYWGIVNPGELIVLAIVIWLFASALVLATRRISETVWICAGLLILAILSLPASVLVYIFPARLSQPFGSALAFTLFLILSIALFVAAMLVIFPIIVCELLRTYTRQDAPLPVLADGLGYHL